MSGTGIMKTYLVTGAAGFIGAAIAKRLIQSGHRVVSIDNMSTGFRDSIPEGVEMIEGACHDPKVIEEVSNHKYDCVMHVAGQSSGEISFDDPVYDLQTNCQSTLQLLKMCMDQGCNNFIYASTMSVYGDKDIQPVGEQVSLTPKSFYAVGKIASEHYLRNYSKLGIRSTALRLFNVYGPGQNLSNLRQGMVSIYLAMALKDKHIHIKGSGDRYRDLVYIDDVVEAFLAAEVAHGNDYEELNVCTGVKTTVKNLVDSLSSKFSFEVTSKYEGSTSGDMFGIVGDPSRIREKLEWQAKVTTDEGLQRMVDWAKGCSIDA
jgi:UDP-glucose 4-epimerase